MKMVQDIKLPQVVGGMVVVPAREFSLAPRNRGELVAWLREYLGYEFPAEAVIEGHRSPLDYLSHVFFQGREGFIPLLCDTSGTGDGADEGAGVAAAQLDIETDRALDTVVWAARGSGKTFLGAVATAIDLIYKPGIEIRILGGSMDQSKRMHAHLRKLFSEEPLAGLVQGRISEAKLTLKNGSEVELLAQSHASVRGTRVQVLRCDEAELFKEDLFEAAMLTTRSKEIEIPGVGLVLVEGSVECLSTMHMPFGIMHRVVKECEAGSRTLFKWGVLDVLGRCGVERVCGGEQQSGKAAERQIGIRENAEGAECAEVRGGEKRLNSKSSKGRGEGGGQGKGNQHGGPRGTTEETHGEEAEKTRENAEGVEVAELRGERKKKKGGGGCALFEECGGRAKARLGNEVGKLVGHMSISDVLRMKRRVSVGTWRSEMLCFYPSRAHSVFPEFDAGRHVFREWEGERAFAVELPRDLSASAEEETEAGTEEGAKGGEAQSAANSGRVIDGLLSAGEGKSEFRVPRLRVGVGAGTSLLLCGIDFGFRAPTVILWAALTRDLGNAGDTLRILDERHVEGATTKEHVESILKGNGFYWRAPDWIGADPAGAQRQSQSGVSDVQLFRDAGLAMRARASKVEEGLRLIRDRLAPATGLPRVLVHERCEKLIEAFTKYHYPPENLECRVPVKDGSDHAIDALRYLIFNLDTAFKTVVRRY